MATHTRSQRQVAAKKAAATRKRNATKRGAAATRTSARQQAARTAGPRLDTAVTRLEALRHQAECALLIRVGAAATVGDKVKQTART